MVSEVIAVQTIQSVIILTHKVRFSVFIMVVLMMSLWKLDDTWCIGRFPQLPSHTLVTVRLFLCARCLSVSFSDFVSMITVEVHSLGMAFF